VFHLISGLGTLAIMHATTQGGVRTGLGPVAGTLTGDLRYMVSAMLGLAAVLAAYPLAVAAMRWVGIAYLVWIGVGMLRSRNITRTLCVLRLGTIRQRRIGPHRRSRGGPEGVRSAGPNQPARHCRSLGRILPTPSRATRVAWALADPPRVWPRSAMPVVNTIR